MNKSEFLHHRSVQSFLKWFCSAAGHLQIDLSIRHSRFVPNGLQCTIHGFGSLTHVYKWRSTNMQEGSWSETCRLLDQLSDKLKKAVNNCNEPAALDACEQILTWGGNRNRNVGAYPFLSALHRRQKLCPYLNQTRTQFQLDQADTQNLAAVTCMNAMLTKVHALNATDGLPIYDSRVAAATATLVELWRVDTDQNKEELPDALRFPALQPNRTVRKLFPDVLHEPGTIRHSTPNATTCWAGAKVRLGWLMQCILERSRDLFSGTPPERMRAFEASLFMIGYDVRALAPSVSSSEKPIEPKFCAPNRADVCKELPDNKEFDPTFWNALCTFGCKKKSFLWQYDSAEDSIKIRRENDTTECFPIIEVNALISDLLGRHRGAWFPLDNNVERLPEQHIPRGLGGAIYALAHHNPHLVGNKRRSHAQAASQLGVILVEIGVFCWNGKDINIAFCIAGGSPPAMDDLRERIELAD